MRGRSRIRGLNRRVSATQIGYPGVFVEVRRERTETIHNMKKFILILLVLSLVGTAAHAQTVDTLLTKKPLDTPRVKRFKLLPSIRRRAHRGP